MQFTEGMEIWRRHRQRGWKPTYAETSLNLFRQIQAYFGTVELSTLGVSDLEKYVRALEERGCRPATLNLHRARLAAFFKYARVHGWLAPGVDLLATWERCNARAPEGWKQTATPAEEERLLRVADPPTALFVMAALYTGLRRGAVYSLRWQWFAPDLSHLTVPGEFMKSGREHRIPIAPKLQAALLPLRPADGLGHLFDQHITPSAWTMRFRRAVKLAGVNPKLKLHDCRRTFGTRLADKGVPVPTIQRLGDWSTASIFYRDYLARLGDDAARAAIDKL